MATLGRADAAHAGKGAFPGGRPEPAETGDRRAAKNSKRRASGRARRAPAVHETEEGAQRHASLGTRGPPTDP